MQKYAKVAVASFIPACFAQRVQGSDPGVSADLHEMISGLATEDLFESDREYLQELWGNTDTLEELDRDFDLFDLNGDSAIDPQELREYPKGQQNHPVYSEFFENVPSERFFSEEEIKEFFYDADEDGDGSVNRKEYHDSIWRSEFGAPADYQEAM